MLKLDRLSVAATLALLPCLSSLTWAGAQTAVHAAPFKCSEVKPASKRQPIYAQRAAGVCEGFFEQPVAGPYLEIISFVRLGSQPAPPPEYVHDLSAPAAAALFVVQPLLEGIPYRVDIDNQGSGARWNAKAMLDATGLQASELGFLALRPASTPARLVLSPVAVGTGASGSQGIAVVRSSVRTSEMKWRSISSKPAPDSATAWQSVPNGAVDKWGLAVISVPLGAEDVQIEVQARTTDAALLPILQFGVSVK